MDLQKHETGYLSIQTHAQMHAHGILGGFPLYNIKPNRTGDRILAAQLRTKTRFFGYRLSNGLSIKAETIWMASVNGEKGKIT